jgi:predicted DNA-binding transcriptional regulator AlpA
LAINLWLDMAGHMVGFMVDYNLLKRALLTVEEIAAFFVVSRDTVYRIAQKGKIPAVKSVISDAHRYTSRRCPTLTIRTISTASSIE